ncbi:DUF1622 domain-containing protein [Parahaliea mediterranea]|uniref:DUF1622 domain-containing protein n=1 Tax=Parahaliea mediterranea TaxID=651086 RepID=UPI000C0A9C9D|nr:DUF1622 domain-containing protein [Parahaliea mediterranea]MAC33278.1 hypothetical protein [Haliea sp.]|tara:strand:- start:12818 stop:13198 length:381 start_codon:yes stop_codon:yes gene_type:complete
MEMLLHVTVLVLEGIGGVIIIGAVGLSLYDLVRAWHHSGVREDVEPVRLQLGQRLVLALEFLIAADILATLHTPSLESIALLAAVILVRTVLSLSIAYELRHAVVPGRADRPTMTNARHDQSDKSS